MILYCATTNEGKLREFRQAAGTHQIEPLPSLKEIPPPAEDGETFEANATQKALYYSLFEDGLLFAEDSGLEVDALQGAPGVYSARFSGPGASDASNNELLRERMRGVDTRTARYRCVIALVEKGQVLGAFSGSVEGLLIDEPRGSNGFGYDPLFYYPPFGCTFAEASPEQKLTVSHRGEAFRKMIAFLDALR